MLSQVLTQGSLYCVSCLKSFFVIDYKAPKWGLKLVLPLIFNFLIMNEL